MPDEERQDNWTKVLRDTLVSFATSCPMYLRLGRTSEARASYEKALALTQRAIPARADSAVEIQQSSHRIRACAAASV